MACVYVLWKRQLLRYVRSRSRLLASLGQPLLYLLGLGFGFAPIYQRAGEGNYIQFIAPGVIAMMLLFTSIFSGMELIWDRQFGFLKETFVAPVSRLQIMLGRTLGSATIALIQASIVAMICLVAGFRVESVQSTILAFVFMALIAVLFTSFGAALGSALVDFQAFQLIINLLVMPMFFLSGALYPLRGVAPALEMIARCNPLSYGVDALRGLTSNSFHFGLFTDFLVLVGSAAVALTLAAYSFSRVEV